MAANGRKSEAEGAAEARMAESLRWHRQASPLVHSGGTRLESRSRVSET